MNEQQLRMAWDLIINGAQVLAVLPLPKLIEACERAESVGWIWDPTLWRDAHVKLVPLLRLLRLAHRFVLDVESVLREVRP